MANNIPLTYVIDVQAPGSQNITKQLKQSLSSADQSADALSVSIRNVGESAENTGKDLSQSSRQIQKYSATQRQASRSTQALSTNSRRSTNTLINFNRVVQDAPFGIIGVANNIDPLLESFQRLKTQAGGARGAFKGLIGALTGPAGVLLAVSAVTSTLVAFGPQIKEFFTDEVQDASESTKDFTKALLDLNNEVSELKGLDKFDATRQDLILLNNEINKIQPKVDELQNIQAEKSFISSQIKGIDALSAQGQERIQELLNKRKELQEREAEISTFVANNEEELFALQEKRKEVLADLASQQRINSSERIQQLRREKEALEASFAFYKNIPDLTEENLNLALGQVDSFVNSLDEKPAQILIEPKLSGSGIDPSDSLGNLDKQIAENEKFIESFIPPERTFANLEDSFRNSFFKIEQIGGQTYKRLREFADLSAQQQVSTFQDGALAVTTSLSAVFGETKALRTAEAVINGSAAIINTFASVPFPANIAAAALIAAKTAKQIANINSTEIGSSAKKPSAGGGGGPTQGFSTGNRSTGGARSVPSVNRRQERQPININVENRLDQRGLSIAAKRGEQQTNQEATIINSDA